MQCPYCQREMEAGVIRGRGELLYSAGKRMLPVRKEGDIQLAADPVSASICSAWNCKTCHRIILEYDEWQIKT